MTSTLPPDWTMQPFAALACRNRRSIRPEDFGGRPYIGLENIEQETLRLSSIGASGGITSTSQLAHHGEIIFGKLRPYFRKVVRAPEEVVVTGEAWVVSNHPTADLEYLFYVMANPSFVDTLTRAATGTRMPRASWDVASAMDVPTPPIPEQRRIAATLGALDSKVALNRRMNHTLEEAARAIFQSWFVDFDGQNDLVMSEEGPIPRSWRLGSVDDVVWRHRENVQPSEIADGTAYVGLEHVPRRSASLEGWGDKEQVTSAKARFAKGDVLFGALRPYFHKVVPAPLNGVCSTDILVLRPRTAHARWFAFGHLYADAMIAHATASSSGTRMPRTKWQDLCRRRIPIPPERLLHQYSAVVDPLYQRLWGNITESRTLTALRDTLLPKLLSGELRVPEALDLVEASS